MQFFVLGSVHAQSAGGVAPIGAPMLRLLLATLLSRANQAVAVDTLIDTIWAGRPVPKARQKLQVHVHRLRHALGAPERIRYDHSAYTLHVRPGELDAACFEELLDEGASVAQSNDLDRGVALIRRAMELWQGDPYGELDDAPLLRTEADRLTERRLGGFEDLYSAELARGRQAVVAAELKGLAEAHPLRERLQEMLILALYRSGRQADALAAYRRTRDALVDGLGIEPGPALAALQAAILAADTALDFAGTGFTGQGITARPAPASAPSAPPSAAASPFASALGSAPAELPAAIADFTGRGQQLERVRSLIADRDALPVVAIAGPPGVGKTALAVRAAHQVKEHYPDGQLYVDLRGADDGPLEAFDVLARLLRALGVSGGGIPDSLDERAALYRSRLAGKRILVFLDNAAGEKQVRPLLPGTAGCGVLVTSRTRPAGLEGARLIDLALFETGQAIELLGKVAGPSRVAAEPGAAEQIVRLCDRLPLAVRIAAARLAARPHWPLARLAARLADERHRLDELCLGDLAVRAGLALSHRALDPLTRRAFRRLGLFGVPQFSTWLVAAVLDTSIDQAEAVVDRLVDAKLLEPVGPAAARYRFHDLIRLYARERAAEDESLTERQDAVERAIDGWLSLTRKASEGLGTGVAGLHRTESTYEPAEAVRDELLADPIGWLDDERVALVAAIDQAAATGLESAACELADILTRYLDIHSHFDDWRRTHQTALAAARRLGCRRAEGVMLTKLAKLTLITDRYDEGRELLELAGEAFRAAGDARGQAEVQYRFGTVHRSLGETDEARRALEIAITMFHQLRDPSGEALALQEIGATYLDLGDGSQAWPYLERALTVFRMLRDQRNEALTLRWLGTAHRRIGQVETAARRLTKSRELFGRLGDVHNLAYVYGDLGRLRLDQEQWAEAEALISRSLTDFRTFGDRHGQARELHDLGQLHASTGDLERAAACLRNALAIWESLGTSLWRLRTLSLLKEVTGAALSDFKVS